MVTRCPEIRIALIYAVVGWIYIFFSDRALDVLGISPDGQGVIQTLKGFGFVGFSALLIFGLTRRWSRQLVQEQQAREAVYTAMASSMNHILRNFLNSVQHLRLTAEAMPDFDPESLRLYDQTIDRTIQRIEALSQVRDATAEKIREQTGMDGPL